MEGGTRFEPHNLLEKRTDAGVLKEGQVARGRPKACSWHRKHENGAEVLMRSALGAGHMLVGEIQLPFQPQRPQKEPLSQRCDWLPLATSLSPSHTMKCLR